MKTAFLILAHRQPAHLARLVRVLDLDWAHTFVHVDRKVDDAPFRSLAGEREGLTFLDAEERVAVNWAGFSVVQATLALLRRALDTGEIFGRFCLLSGADFPIKPAEHIRDRFAGGDQFLRVAQRLGDSDANPHCRYVRRYYFADLPEKQELSGRIARDPYRKISLYHGAQWWSLTAGCVRYVLDFVENNPDYLDFHKWTFAPDEIFFHSIVKSSPFAAAISHDFERTHSYQELKASKEHGCTYVDWHPSGSGLRVLEEADYDALVRSRCLFARKFDELRSKALIDRLEASSLTRPPT